MIKRKLLNNCFLLIVPILIWNLTFVAFLPKPYSSEVFWKDIPPLIGFSENILRIIVLVLPSIMILSLKTRLQNIGFIIYFLGVLIYFTSWMLQIKFRNSTWSKSLMGFMLPALSPIIWLIGIGLIGEKNFLRIPYLALIYTLISLAFVFFHSLHAYIVFLR